MPHYIIGIIGTALVVLIEVAVILALWGPPNWNRIERRKRRSVAMSSRGSAQSYGAPIRVAFHPERSAWFTPEGRQ